MASAIYLELKDFERALDWAEQLEDPLLSLRLRALANLRLRRTDQAVEAAELAILRDPRDPVAPRTAALALIDRLWGRPRDGPAAAADAVRLHAYAEETAERSAADDPDARRLLRVAEELVLLTDHSTRDIDMNPTIKNRLRCLAAAVTLTTLAAPAFGQIQIGPHRGTFGEVKRLDSKLDTALTEWGPSVTEDGRIIVFGRGANGVLDLWMAQREDSTGEFESPEPIAELNTDFSENNPSISADGLVLVFSSNRPSGQGASDLYIAHREDLDSPFEIEVIGFPINTDLEDFDGQISPDGLRLYFSRALPPGPGEVNSTHPDLFVAVLESLRWFKLSTRVSATGRVPNSGLPTEVPRRGPSGNGRKLSGEIDATANTTRSHAAS